MNRNIGRLLAVVFGLTLFLEVACLPLISSMSLQVEKACVAELTELDEEAAEKSFDLFQFLALSIHHFTNDFAVRHDHQPVFDNPRLSNVQQTPVFILHRHILI